MSATREVVIFLQRGRAVVSLKLGPQTLTNCIIDFSMPVPDSGCIACRQPVHAVLLLEAGVHAETHSIREVEIDSFCCAPTASIFCLKTLFVVGRVQLKTGRKYSDGLLVATSS